MRKGLFVFFFALLVSGCSIITKPCNPPCAPGSVCIAGACVTQPTPPPAPPGSPVCDTDHLTDCWEWSGGDWSWRDCRETGCPTGIACIAGHADVYACNGHVCQAGEFCNCYHNPTGTEWLLASCGVGQTCEGTQCVTSQPVCPAQCPEDQHCSDPAVGCVPNPPNPPPASACPKALAPGAYVRLNTSPYNPHVNFYATPYVHGDPEFCRLIHGVSVNDCHLEGWPKQSACEVELVGQAVEKDGACPIWQFSTDGGGHVEACVDDSGAAASCDHFGSVQARDDPKTPTRGESLETLSGFEGEPKVCGLQRDIHGPMAGFFVVANGGPHNCQTASGPYWSVRACLPDGTNCGQWRPFCH